MKALEHLNTRHHGRAIQSSSPYRCVARAAHDLLADPAPVSDTASVNAAADLSGPAIAEILAANGLVCREISIVPDEIPLIQQVIMAWVNGGETDWIITTGGTGFGVRDTTPEVRDMYAMWAG